MFRIDNPTAVTAQPASTPAGTPGWFTDGNPAGGVPATILPAEWLNAIQEEFISVLTQAGITPDKTKFNQIAAALRQSRQQPFTSSGSFTVPPGVTTIYRSACGGGAGGGGGGSTVGNTAYYGGGGGCGGGAGQSVVDSPLAVTPGQVINITVGAGGQGSPSVGTNGTAGSATVIGTLTLSGGTAGGAGQANVGTTGSTIGAAGGSPQGTLSFPLGQCGGDGQLAGLGGCGASSPFGGGGGGGRGSTSRSTVQDGSPGGGFGAGGGGGGAAYGLAAGIGSFGAAGTPGIAIIRW
jgi:hypothetical protein